MSDLTALEARRDVFERLHQDAYRNGLYWAACAYGEVLVRLNEELICERFLGFNDLLRGR